MDTGQFSMIMLALGGIIGALLNISFQLSALIN